MHAGLFLFLAAILALGVVAQSPVSTTYVCPTSDQCQAPLCSDGVSAVYGGTADDFTCYYSQLSGAQLCDYPLSADSDLYCVYSSSGTLLQDHNDECCKTTGTAGSRPVRMKARDADPAPPAPGLASPGDALRKRVDAWRARDATRRLLAEVGPNEVEQRAVKKHVVRGPAHH